VKYFVDEVHMSVETADASGLTLLHKAAENGHIEILHFLISKGANKESMAFSRRKYTPLYRAVQFGNFQAVQYFLDHYDNLNIAFCETPSFAQLQYSSKPQAKQIMESIQSYKMKQKKPKVKPLHFVKEQKSLMA